MPRGRLPRPAYPRALREAAPPRWRAMAQLTLTYAKANHAPHGRLTEVAGALATAAMQTTHAVLAARGTWVTNEKTLLYQAGLRDVDRIVAGLTPGPDTLAAAISDAEALFTAAS